MKAENLSSSSVAENTYIMVNFPNGRTLSIKLTILDCRCGAYIYMADVLIVCVCVCVCVCVNSSRLSMYLYMARIMYCTTTISESCCVIATSKEPLYGSALLHIHQQCKTSGMCA